METIGVIFGAIVAITVIIILENLRKLHIEISISESFDANFDVSHHDRETRFLRVLVQNKPLPKWANWMSRNAVTQCRAEISFYHLDNQNVFGRSMLNILNQLL